PLPEGLKQPAPSQRAYHFDSICLGSKLLSITWIPDSARSAVCKANVHSSDAALMLVESGATSLSFFARLPGGRATFLCMAKERWPKERPPREHVLSTSLCSGCASGRRGSPKAHPCACGELARILRAILRTFPSSARRVRGVLRRASCARTPAKHVD